MGSPIAKRDILALVVIALSYLGMAGYQMSYPEVLLWDEKRYIPQAREIAQGGPIEETTHPPLGKFLTAASIYVVGDDPFAWRLPSLIAGAGILCVLYALGLVFNGERWTGSLAAILFAFESLAFVQSRTGLYSPIMLFFMLLAVLSMAKWYEGCGRRALVGAALAFGAAVATRWVALSVIVVIAFLWWKGMRRSQQSVKSSVVDIVIFGAVSAALYGGLFVIGPLSRGEGILDALYLNYTMFSEHWTNLSTTHRYASPWWTWPLMLRPVWWGFESYPMTAPDGSQVVEGILSIGNPVLFAAIPFAVFCGVRKVYRAHNFFLTVMLVGFFTQWLQWSWVPRNTYLHYFYTALPFAALLVADMLVSLWRQSRVGRAVCLGYLVSAVAMFAYWYPLLTAMKVSRDFVMRHIWLATWWS